MTNKLKAVVVAGNTYYSLDDIPDLVTENEQLRSKYKALVVAYDKQCGTPCEEVRHHQEVEKLKAENLRLSAQTHYLKGLCMRLVDRWWPFVHGGVAVSETARNLLGESQDVICLKPDVCLEKYALEQQAKGVDDGSKACAISLGEDAVVIGEAELYYYAEGLRQQAKELSK